jgi:hypothetical protein
VTALDPAFGPPKEALNRLADAAPGAAESVPPKFEGAPFCTDGNIVPRPVDDAEVGPVVEVAAVVGAVLLFFSGVVPAGSVVVTFGSVVLMGSVVVTFGRVVVTFGSVVLMGSVVVTFGTVVVTFGSVVLTGSVVETVGSAVVMLRAGADHPATAVLATKPSRARKVKGAASLTALEYPE